MLLFNIIIIIVITIIVTFIIIFIIIMKEVGSLHLPLQNARVFWYSKVCLCYTRMLNTAITVPILLLVLLPSAAKRSLIFDSSFLMVSLTSGIIGHQILQNVLNTPTCPICFFGRLHDNNGNKIIIQRKSLCIVAFWKMLNNNHVSF